MEIKQTLSVFGEEITQYVIAVELMLVKVKWLQTLVNIATNKC